MANLSMTICSRFGLKYRDRDGDMCTLAPETVEHIIVRAEGDQYKNAENLRHQCRFIFKYVAQGFKQYQGQYRWL